MRLRREDIKSVPLFKAYDPASRQIASGTWVKVPIATVIVDNRGTFNPALNRYCIPESGIYNVFGRVYGQFYLNPNSWSMNAVLYKNGSIVCVGNMIGGYPGGGGTSWSFMCIVNDLIPLVKGDFIELYMSCSSASTIILGAADSSYANFLAAQRVG